MKYRNQTATDAGEISKNTSDSNARNRRVKTRLVRRESFSNFIGERTESLASETATDSFSAILEIVDGPEQGKRVQLVGPFNSVGRGKGQDIRLAHDETVSRTDHAVIAFVQDMGSFVIFDGGKVNPIWINNVQLVDMCPLESGDLIRIGETSMRFYLV